uniref:Thylakoid membrane phosphoprotein 14 kDa, chloroplast n=1 Tax=Solanum tuberosum TaxID=4113 RepID=M1BDD5_SOLTU
MASIVVAKLHPPPPAITGRQTLFGTVHTSTLFVPTKRQGHLAITAKATSESSESLSSPSVVKSVKNVWDNPEDRIAVIGLGIAAIVGFWASSNFVAVIFVALLYIDAGVIICPYHIEKSTIWPLWWLTISL